MLKHDARHYDDYLRLRVSPLLWFVLIYGIRHFFFLAAAKLMPLEVEATPWIALQVHINLMLSDLPALLVLVATGYRIPEAVRLMRWIWLHGCWILAFSYLLGLAVFINQHIDIISNFNGRNFIAALFVVLPDIAIIGYLLRSKLVRDIFSEFPEAVVANGVKSAAKSRHVCSARQHAKELTQEMDEAKRNELLRQQMADSTTKCKDEKSRKEAG